MLRLTGGAHSWYDNFCLWNRTEILRWLLKANQRTLAGAIQQREHSRRRKPKYIQRWSQIIRVQMNQEHDLLHQCTSQNKTSWCLRCVSFNRHWDKRGYLELFIFFAIVATVYYAEMQRLNILHCTVISVKLYMVVNLPGNLKKVI